MKRQLFALLVALIFSVLCPATDVSVRGYTRKDGTYVAPHVRSSPNSTKDDNYSTRGNVNPYTGVAGTKPGDSGVSTAPTAASVQPAVAVTPDLMATAVASAAPTAAGSV